MSHEIETVNGQHEAVYASDPAWHGLGEVWEPGKGLAPTSADIEENFPSIFFHVDKKPVYDEQGKEVPNYHRLVRQDTGKCLNVVGNRYEILQNREAFEFMDSLQMDGIIRYESAFVLKGGESVVLLARMPETDVIGDNDVSLRYIMAKVQHGGGATIMTPTSVRVVCANTVRVAVRESKYNVSIAHNGCMEKKLEQAKLYLSQFNQAFTLYNENANKLVKRYTPEQAKDYIEMLFPTPDRDKKAATTKHNKKIEELQSYFYDKAQRVPEAKGTWWGMFNTVTAFIDHGSRKKSKDPRKASESRYVNAIEDKGAKLKNKAFELALEMAA